MLLHLEMADVGRSAFLAERPSERGREWLADRDTDPRPQLERDRAASS